MFTTVRLEVFAKHQHSLDNDVVKFCPKDSKLLNWHALN